MPTWASILDAAETWHVPPWVIEEEVTPYWWERYLIWSNLKARVREEAQRKAKRGKV